MSEPAITPELWHQLEQVAKGYVGVDLRFEQGSFLIWLDSLVSMGLVDFHQGEPGYTVGYSITHKGRALLEEYRKNQPPQESS